jgi:formylglycine-generating enzyme required for sulfatase activity
VSLIHRLINEIERQAGWRELTTFRDRLKVGGEGPLMVVIPVGRFLMGSPPDEPERPDDEGPQHEVKIAKPFAMGVYAVTFDEYARFAEATGRRRPKDEDWGRGKRPVIHVAWDDAQAYCAWLTDQTGWTYRLPSEAEWEYACRAGTTTPFHFGARISTDQANFNGSSTYNGSAKGEYRQKTLPVGTFAPNAFGLYDMHGNVWEWCEDAWQDYHEGTLSPWHASFFYGTSWAGVMEADGVASHVLRGGSWDAPPRYCRAACRIHDQPFDRWGWGAGFRVCCSSP